MNADAEAAIRRILEAEKANGRSDVEAAGIALWLDGERSREGLLSEEKRREAEEVILGWLGDDAGSESTGAQALVARQLARFLGEHIRYRTEPPELKIEAALQRWREEAGMSPERP
jgi:hypothetical protein